jgi:hypothetical protein
MDGHRRANSHLESLAARKAFSALSLIIFSPARRRFFLALSTRDIFHMLNGQFFSYGGDLCPPSFRTPSAYGTGHSKFSIRCEFISLHAIFCQKIAKSVRAIRRGNVRKGNEKSFGEWGEKRGQARAALTSGSEKAGRG